MVRIVDCNSESWENARATPRAAFNSSHAPHAAMRGSDFETRRPNISDVIPLSPVFVAIDMTTQLVTRLRQWRAAGASHLRRFIEPQRPSAAKPQPKKARESGSQETTKRGGIRLKSLDRRTDGAASIALRSVCGMEGR